MRIMLKKRRRKQQRVSKIMEVSIKSRKRKLRHEALVKRRAMSRYEREKDSITIYNRLIENELYKNAKCVFCYVSVEDEVHTDKILRQALTDGKELCVPYIVDTENAVMKAAQLKSIGQLTTGVFGIRTVKNSTFQEVLPEAIDLVIAPGIAFDRRGHRIGMGGGYYDIFLKKVERADKLAVAYDCQILDDFEVDKFDVAVDYILTTMEIIKCTD